MKKRIFLSYSHADGTDFMEQVKAWLEYGEFEVATDATWSKGVVFDEMMQKEINDADLVLALVTPAYKQSPNTGYELIQARNNNKLLEVLCTPDIIPMYTRINAFVLVDEDQNSFLSGIFSYFNNQKNNTLIPATPKQILKGILEDIHDVIQKKKKDIAVRFGAFVVLDSKVYDGKLVIDFVIQGKTVKDLSTTLYLKKSKFMDPGNFIITESDDTDRMSGDDKSYRLEQINGELRLRKYFDIMHSDKYYSIKDFGVYFYNEYIEKELP